MTIQLDHTIVAVKDRDASAAFYEQIFGFQNEGRLADFLILRVNPSLTLDLIAAKRPATRHFAFSMEADEFEAVFGRIKAAGIPYGDGPFSLDNKKGPGQTQGARGMGKAVYFRDPNGHILEIKTYSV